LRKQLEAKIPEVRWAVLSLFHDIDNRRSHDSRSQRVS